MKPGFEIFASRFARRLFTVFIASAILPVLTLAVLSFNRVPDQLLVQNEQQQRQEVKARKSKPLAWPFMKGLPYWNQNYS
jgi:hypothetical protein